MAASTVSPSSLIHPSRIPNRWVQLIAGIVAMMAIANLQYAWTLFTKPMQAHLHVSPTLPSNGRSPYSSPLKPGWFLLRDTWWIRLGRDSCSVLGAFMVGLGWIGSGQAEDVAQPLFLVQAGRTRCRHRLWRRYWKRAEMVPGPSRSLRRALTPELSESAQPRPSLQSPE